MRNTASSRPRASVLAIGNELLNGAISDSNTAAVCRFLDELGIQVCRGALARDVDAEIIAELRAAASAADIVFTTGGLGPTSDDRTRYAIAEFSGKPLKEDAAARSKLERLFAERRRKMSETNLRQVFFPEGADVLENAEGTADAFVTSWESAAGRKVSIVSLPGIPRELKHLLESQVAGWIEKHCPNRPVSRRRYLRCFGRSESYLGKKIEELRLSSALEVAYRPMFPEILLSFFDHRSASPGAEEELASAVASVRRAVGEEFVFSEEAAGSMAETVFRLLRDRALRVAAAESCSGGLFADALVSLPGSSQIFVGSFVTYCDEAKQEILGVSGVTLDRHGAVSAETAVEMARGARLRTKADIAVSITGVAGPGGGSAEKPPGTVWIGLAAKDGEHAVMQSFAVERNMFRAFCAASALDLIRRKLLGLPLEWQRL